MTKILWQRLECNSDYPPGFREMLNFAQKITDKITKDIDNNQQTPQVEMYSLINILKNLSQANLQIPEPKPIRSKKLYQRNI